MALIVSIETAQDAGCGWTPSEKAVCIGDSAGIPVIVGFDSIRLERPIETLLGKEPRADIVPQCFSGDCREPLRDGTPCSGLLAGRERGVYCDVAHGGGTSKWSVSAAKRQTSRRTRSRQPYTSAR